jgi:hypothetical protein
MEPKKLRLGVECPTPSAVDEETRVAVLQATVKKYLRCNWSSWVDAASQRTRMLRKSRGSGTTRAQRRGRVSS